MDRLGDHCGVSFEDFAIKMMNKTEKTAISDLSVFRRPLREGFYQRFRVEQIGSGLLLSIHQADALLNDYNNAHHNLSRPTLPGEPEQYPHRAGFLLQPFWYECRYFYR